MTAAQVRDLLVKQAWLIVICTICGVIGALVGTAFITPTYQAVVTVHAEVSPETPTTYTLLVLDRLIGTEAQLATSQPILRTVVAKYPGETVQSLTPRVTATPKANTQLFQIAVVDSNPARAASLANSIAAALIADQEATMRQRNLKAEQEVQQKITDTQAQIQSVTVKLSDPQLAPADSDGLKAQLQSLQDAYKQYLDTQSQLQIQDGLNTILLYVKIPAVPDTRPVRPVIPVNLALGLVCGLLVGIMLVIVRAQLRQRFKTSDEIAQFLGYPILADMTAVSNAAVRSRRGATPSTANAVDGDLYLRLQKAIGFLGIDRPLRALAFTGALPRDGASTLAADWATFLAQHGRKTLLIDADLQHPSIAGYLGVQASGGLSDAALVLAKGDPGPAALQRYMISGAHIGIPALIVMPAGSQPPNPRQVLESQAMGKLFRALLATEPEMAIFTTPSGAADTTASSLEANVDGVLIVIDLRRARKRHLARLSARLKNSGARILGIVILTDAWAQSEVRQRGTPHPGAQPLERGPASVDMNQQQQLGASPRYREG